MAAAFAIAMPSYDRRFSVDWAKENERRAAGQRAEQQHHADFLARLIKEQDERQIERPVKASSNSGAVDRQSPAQVVNER
jgi:hypothetical protein